jgi:2-succinyl-5-enolpyruvyl-6-hydroxy-3-cyclohexene-1-carboxylate synthase
LRVGGPTTNKPLTQWLDPSIDQVLVDPDDAWLDPQHAVSGRMVADPELLLGALADAVDVMIDEDWLQTWAGADTTACRAIDEVVDAWDEPFEGRIARDVVRSAPAGTSLVVASSMPVRDVESFAPRREGVTFYANRGVNGIDGFVSTVLGVAAGSDGPAVALVGDLCYLHDSNGLLGAVDRGIDATFVVVDNGGGGIFSFLPQAELADHFETLFGTPQPVDLAVLTRVHGIPVHDVAAAGELEPALAAAVDAGGVQVVRVRTDRAVNVTRHREVWAAVADSLRNELREAKATAQ